MSLLKTCENCLTAVGSDETTCHYCGHGIPYDGHILPHTPRTVGQEMTFATILNDLVTEEPEITRATILIDGKPVKGVVYWGQRTLTRR